MPWTGGLTKKNLKGGDKLFFIFFFAVGGGDEFIKKKALVVLKKKLYILIRNIMNIYLLAYYKYLKKSEWLLQEIKMLIQNTPTVLRYISQQCKFIKINKLIQTL